MDLTALASVQLVSWKIMESYNLDPASIFREVHLDPNLMYEQGARYPVSKIEALWQTMERRIEDPGFGLCAAEPNCWHPSYFGTLGYAMLVSMSLRIALERLLRFHRVISDVDFGKLHEDRETRALVLTLNPKDETKLTRAREDALLAWIMSTMRMNFQDELAAVSVHLTHDPPEHTERYNEFFKSPVNFNSPVSSLALPLESVDRILPSRNDDLAEFKDQIMTKYLATLDKYDLLAKTRKIIVEHLPSGNATVNNVAHELGYSSRSFQRLLKQKGTTFIALLNEVRMKLAVQYVRDKSKNLTEIAFLLGFAELSTFSRSFKRWTGKSLQQFRKAEV